MYDFSEALKLLKQGDKMTLFEFEYPYYFTFTEPNTFWVHHIYDDEKNKLDEFRTSEILSDKWIIYKGTRKY